MPTNYRTAVTPVAHRKEMRDLTPEEVLFVRETRLVHNGIGTWANALLHKGWTISDVKKKLKEIAKEVDKI